MTRHPSPILIGTSGWYYQDWIGGFYPQKLAGYRDLTFYAQSFPTVENNSAFYHVPQKSMIQKWIKATPENFMFSVKLNQNITHTHALAINDESKSLLNTYFESVGQLDQKLGTILIQLPGRLRCDVKKLDVFLKYYTQHYPVRTSIEFRDTSWFQKEIYAVLEKYNVALTIAQSSRYPLDQTITADFGYFRFHGPEKLFMSSYSQKELEHWAGLSRHAQKR